MDLLPDGWSDCSIRAKRNSKFHLAPQGSSGSGEVTSEKSRFSTSPVVVSKSLDSIRDPVAWSPRGGAHHSDAALLSPLGVILRDAVTVDTRLYGSNNDLVGDSVRGTYRPTRSRMC